MLLDVRKYVRTRIYSLLRVSSVALAAMALLWTPMAPSQTQQPTPSGQSPTAAPQSPTATPPVSSPNATSAQPAPPFGTQTPSGGLNIVVLDPAHGGTDPGARGTGGIRESDIVLDLALQVRRALEEQGFQVVQTRQGNENPSFDDRSAVANAQRGAVFVTLHISSTGLPGTARVYVNSDFGALTNSNGLIPWEHAQAPFLGLSRKFGNTVQGFLTQRFKGSPDSAQTASVRQLRTTAAPAIAVEISSITVEDRAELDRMASGVADAIARGTAAFKPSYVVAGPPGTPP